MPRVLISVVGSFVPAERLPPLADTAEVVRHARTLPGLTVLAPMPSRLSASRLYGVFTVQGGEQIFPAVVSDTQWAAFCQAFELPELQADARLPSNNDRVRARDWLLPLRRERLATLPAAMIAERFETLGLPFAPITQAQQLFDDPHLAATGGLAPVTLPADASGAGQPVDTRTALLPLTPDGLRLPD